MSDSRTREQRIQEMLDHHDIRTLLSTYCHACDRGDGAMMSGVYAPVSWDDHGLYKGSGQGFTRSVMQRFADDEARCVHLLGQALIRVSGDQAGAESYFLATILDRDSKGAEQVTLLGGRYVDSLERLENGWKIKSRVVIRDWSRRLDGKTDPLANDNFAEGRLSGDDLSYSALSLEHSGLRSWLAACEGAAQ
jgi:SnoaL-like domain